MKENKNNFEFVYVAPSSEERKEIQSIKEKYLKKEPQSTKLQYLRKLDNKVRSVPLIVSLTMGIIGVLVFGLGLTMILEWDLMMFGIIVGLVGCALIGLAYFVYNKLFSFFKRKYGDEIIQLSNELLNEEKQ